MIFQIWDLSLVSTIHFEIITTGNDYECVSMLLYVQLLDLVQTSH